MTAYQERLVVPVRWWLLAAAACLAVAMTAAPLGTGPALTAAAVLAVLLTAGLVSYGGARLRVQDGVLITEGLAVRVERLGWVEILDEDEALEWRTFRAGPHASFALRAYIPTAVRVEVADPSVPFRYLYVSTRHPLRVVRAINAARPGARQ
ncbi:DUF3093 family protein [Streptomyces sp. NPDC057445]|uniref:DUF3093 family protein n=1 Tax=Streptomyces sp. NPDC057445 TaxID=3346136 RepID=UPI0036CDC2D7